MMESGVPAGVGVLVVGHGTADPVGAGECRQVAAAVAGLLPGVAVELGFLEVIAPTIDDALARLVARGCHDVVAAPLLLFAAGHARHDVPEAVAAAASVRGVRVRQSAAFGAIDAIVQASVRRRQEAVAARPPVSARETVLVMVGRGSSDPTALAQLRELADAIQRRQEWTPQRVEYGFVAAARPRLDEALEAACDPIAGSVRRIVVHPHLLFSGHVEDQVSDAVEAARSRRPDIDWVRVPRLGADPLVARAVVQRVAEEIGRPSPARQGEAKSSQ
jgi:sirohydrochlorin cobaltochelatase